MFAASFLLLLASFLTIPVVAVEASVVEWQKTYGGIGVDYTWSMIQTSDGGYAMAGESQVGDTAIFYARLVKTDADGNAVWNKTYEGTFRSVVQTVDGGYAMAGIFLNDFLLVKVDANGNGQWRRTFDPVKSPENGYTSSTRDYAWGLVQTADGGYALVGYTDAYDPSSDVWLVKTDANGIALWNKTFSGPDTDWAYEVVQTGDGGYAIGGGTRVIDRGMDFWLIRTDLNGNELWNKTYGTEETDSVQSIIQTSEGGFAFAGGDWLYKTDGFGDEQWNKTYASGWNSLVQTTDGGYALAGEYGGNFSFMKTDAMGEYEWNYTLGGSGYDAAHSVVQTVDGGYALSGPTQSYGAGKNDFWLVKIAPGVIPEFQSGLIIVVLIIASTLIIVLIKKKDPA